MVAMTQVVYRSALRIRSAGSPGQGKAVHLSLTTTDLKKGRMIPVKNGRKGKNKETWRNQKKQQAIAREVGGKEGFKG